MGKNFIFAVFLLMFALLVVGFFAGGSAGTVESGVSPEDVTCIIQKYKTYRAPGGLFEKKAGTRFDLYRKRMYTVEQGDTLSSISIKFYGTSGKWEKIVKANSDGISGPKDLRAGMRIFIPEDRSADGKDSGKGMDSGERLGQFLKNRR